MKLYILTDDMTDARHTNQTYQDIITFLEDMHDNIEVTDMLQGDLTDQELDNFATGVGFTVEVQE